jgi:hypothetical protein
MSPTEIKMQPIIHFQKKAGYFNFSSQLFSEMCCVGVIITREIPCILWPARDWEILNCRLDKSHNIPKTFSLSNIFL